MYVKLHVCILDSSIADNRRLRHFFTDLLLCSDPTGIVMMTAQAIARRIGCDVAEVEWGLAELCKPDPQSKTPDHEGRRIEPLGGHGYGWQILNYQSYRALKDGDQMREATRLRVQRHRERKKVVVTGGNVTDTEVTPLQKKKQSQKKINTPLPPKGGESGLEESKNDSSHSDQVRPTTARAIRVAAIMHRRADTPWNPKEVRAYRQKGGAATSDEKTFAAVEAYYAANWPPDRDKNILRHDLLTLMNNWQGEADRAMRQSEAPQKQARHWEEDPK